MKKILLLPLFLLLASAVFAQDKGKSKDISRLLELTGSNKLGAQIVNKLLQDFRGSFIEVPASFWENAKKDIDTNGLEALIVPIYDKYYSHDEIKELIRFYESPVGQKMVRTMPQVLNESMDAGRKWGEEIGRKVLEKLNKR